MEAIKDSKGVEVGTGVVHGQGPEKTGLLVSQPVTL